jgi:hypothetical protein
MATRTSNEGKSFRFKGIGNGVVIHEATANFEGWSAVVQILEFRDNEHAGEIDIRFGYCSDRGNLIARPLYLDESQLTELGRAIARYPEIRRFFRGFCDQVR